MGLQLVEILVTHLHLTHQVVIEEHHLDYKQYHLICKGLVYQSLSGDFNVILWVDSDVSSLPVGGSPNSITSYIETYTSSSTTIQPYLLEM